MDHVGCNFQILVHLINDFHGSMVIALIYNCEILILKIFVKINKYISLYDVILHLSEEKQLYIIIYQAKIIYSLNLFNLPLSTDSNGSSTIQSRMLD